MDAPYYLYLGNVSEQFTIRLPSLKFAGVHQDGGLLNVVLAICRATACNPPRTGNTTISIICTVVALL